MRRFNSSSTIIKTIFYVLIILSLPSVCFSAGSLLNLTPEEIKWLDEHPGLKLIFRTEIPPVEFLSETKEFTGVSADVVALIEKRIGISFVKEPASGRVNSTAELIKNNICDLIPASIRTPEREKYMFFTKAYLSVPLVFITSKRNAEKKTTDEFINKKIAVVSNFAGNRKFREIVGNKFIIVPVSSTFAGMIKLSLGEVDGMIENLAVAGYYINKSGISGLKVVSPIDYSINLHIGISKKHPDLFSIVSKALDDIDDREIANIRKKWFFAEINTWLSPETILFLEFASFFTILLIAGLISISYFLKKRLGQSERKFKKLFERNPVPLAILSKNGKFIDINNSMTQTLGYELKDLPDAEAWFEKAYRDENIRVEAKTAWDKAVEDAEKSGQNVRSGEYNIVCKNDDIKSMVISGTIIGNIILVIFFDITERNNLREQLYQTQKMEAIGQLAGGIAHDINNMLSVIIGNTDIAIYASKNEKPVTVELKEIENAAVRSREIIRQLMAFARRQIVEAVVIDMNRTVDKSINMLKRLIGESIDLVWIPSDSVRPVKADPGQIEQILVNLCINARDAVSEVGKITIETDSRIFDEEYCRSHVGFKEGCYTMLAVSDNGSGIENDIEGRIFEPFFTTKKEGKGTGLGLSTVYGIVKQNDGFINLYSEPGIGTTFRIYLPWYEMESETAMKDRFEYDSMIGSETILLVEDEESILKMTRRILEDSGYRVFACNNPDSALKIADKYENEISLLITDVIMPGTNGKIMAEKLLKKIPTLKCLYISGYTANVIAHHGVLDEGIQFLQKPFSREGLLIKIRETLAED